MIRQKKDLFQSEESKTAVIIGAGDFTDREIKDPYDLLIAADGGLTPLRKLGLQPDVIVGDFDSLGYVPDPAYSGTGGGKDVVCETGSPGSGCRPGPEIIRLQVEKDDTDMDAACRIAWERGSRTLRLYGGTGSRPDHFLGNLQLGARFSRLGGDVRLIAPEYTVYFLTGPEGPAVSEEESPSGGTLLLEREPGTTFSVFSWGEAAEGVTIAGDVKYPVRDITMTNTRTLGVSNLFTGRTACVSVRRGTLLVLAYHKPENAE